MKKIINYLNTFKDFVNIKSKHELAILNDKSFSCYLLSKYYENPKLTLVVLDNLLHVQNLYGILEPTLKDKVLMFTCDEMSKVTVEATSPELVTQRLYILNKAINNEPIIVLTHTMAYKRILPTIETFKRHKKDIKVGDILNKDDLISYLLVNGYNKTMQVSQPFEYSTRGGVVDLFSINYKYPIRIEFFDNEVESIRFFEIESQRKISLTNEIETIPGTELLIDDLKKGISKIQDELEKESKHCSNPLTLQESIENDIERIRTFNLNEIYYKYYSYLNDYSDISEYFKEAEVYIYDYQKIKDCETFIETENVDKIDSLFDEGRVLYNILQFKDVNEITFKLNNKTMIDSDDLNHYDLEFTSIDPFEFNYDLLYKEIINMLSKSYTIYIGLENETQYNAIKDFLNSKDLIYHEEDTLVKGINLGHEDFSLGLDISKYKLAIIGEKEIFNKRIKKAITYFNKYKNTLAVENINDLVVGDYLVHETHGIGIYRGIETENRDGIHRDYIKIEYKNNAFLFLPLEQFVLVRKYVSKEGAKPPINTLGTKTWEKTKQKIKERVNEIAARLVTLYSTRAKNQGFAFEKDDDLSEAFENDFPYPLTNDQQKVLEEIKNDMEQPIIMDRLLVGDVGYGKTEVAFRAAFKAINSGKQVALLCPTTLLCSQHYKVAVERFKNFGIKIEMVSRMVSDKKVNEILRDVSTGKIDFLIGTHRLLSKDVIFKDLGLLIVDEEHKFGVEHKERIKEIKESVDVLTLSATPIPRTLEMALTGVRSFSIINTPIEDRMPVQTYVMPYDTFAIKEIIERELARNGQVFYLNNKIERLPAIAKYLEKNIPSCKVAIAHGKMNQDDIEDTMQSFINNEYNVLLCTTIIENGIDIENVNTIIVENAEMFGLSQLYQIKGRVGRGNRLAYAYLMYKKDKDLSDIAKNRLKTIKEFAQLGSGYKVAMRDLITRGAGDLLGEEQSGFIDCVGIDMYIEMLRDAINQTKNNITIDNEPKKVSKPLHIDAYVPPSYFDNDYQKIDLYKKVDSVKNVQELLELREKMADETGKLPKSIELIFEKKNIDLFERNGIIKGYNEFDNYVLVKLSDEFSSYRSVGVKLFQEANRISNAITLKFNVSTIEVHIKKVNNWLDIMLQYINVIADIKKEYEK